MPSVARSRLSRAKVRSMGRPVPSKSEFLPRVRPASKKAPPVRVVQPRHPLLRDNPVFGRHVDVENLLHRLDSFARARQSHSLVVFRLGGLKEINSRFGSSTGDNVVGDVVHSLSQLARSNAGVSARVGRDLFALVLPVTAGKANEVANDWKQSISAREAVAPAGTRFLDRHAWRAPTIRLGVATGLSDAKGTQKHALDALNASPNGILGLALDPHAYWALPPGKKRAG